MMKFFNPFANPSRTPLVTSLVVGTLSLALVAYSPWSVLLGVGAAVAVSSYVFLKLRNRFYDFEELSWLKNSPEEKVAQAAERAASSYLEYGKSFLSQDAWRHSKLFGGVMHAEMKKIAKNEEKRNQYKHN